MGAGVAALAMIFVASIWRLPTQQSEADHLSPTKPNLDARTKGDRKLSGDRKISDVHAEDHRKSNDDSGLKKGFLVATDGTVGVPARYHFEDVRRVQTGRNFEDWMARFPKADQEVLRQFDERYFGIYHGRTAQDIAWMAAHGYPLPEDLLAAQSVGTERLRKMAEKGNVKAAFLLKDRDLKTIAEMPAEENWMLDPELKHDFFITFDKVVTGAASPFKAFLSARGEHIFYHEPVDVDAGVIGALYWAYSLGDLGAQRRLTTFVNAADNPERRRFRSAMVGAASAVYGNLSKSMDQLPKAGCTDLIGVGPGYNPTGHAEQ